MNLLTKMKVIDRLQLRADLIDYCDPNSQYADPEVVQLKRRILLENKLMLQEAVHTMSMEPKGSPVWHRAYEQYKKSAQIVQSPFYQSNSVRLVHKRNYGYYPGG